MHVFKKNEIKYIQPMSIFHSFIMLKLCQIVHHRARLGIFKSKNFNSQHLHGTILLQWNKEDTHISCCMLHKIGGDNSKTFRICLIFYHQMCLVIIFIITIIVYRVLVSIALFDKVRCGHIFCNDVIDFCFLFATYLNLLILVI